MKVQAFDTFTDRTGQDVSRWGGYEQALASDPEGVKAVLRQASRIERTPGRDSLSPGVMHELAWIIQRESSWNPHIQNSIGCTGLIQFCKGAAESLGTTLSELSKMSLTEQAPYVGDYFLMLKKKVSKPGDLYMLTFYPEHYAKPDDFVIADKSSTGFALKVWEQNPGLRLSPDGPITAGGVRAYGTPKDEPSSGFPDLGKKGKGGARSSGAGVAFLGLAIGGFLLWKKGSA